MFVPFINLMFIHKKRIKYELKTGIKVKPKNFRASKYFESGYIANKRKNAGNQKAWRKEINLPRLIKKFNNSPVLSDHAKQRLQERGPVTKPIYKDLKQSFNQNKRIIVTYIPQQDTRKNAHERINNIRRLQKKSAFDRRNNRPKIPLSNTDVTILKHSKKILVKEEQERRLVQRRTSLEKAGFYSLYPYFTYPTSKTQNKYKQPKLS